jgi:hypothetical protein
VAVAAEGPTFAEGYTAGVRAERERLIVALREHAQNAKKFSEEDGREHLGYWEGRMDLARQVVADLGRANAGV